MNKVNKEYYLDDMAGYYNDLEVKNNSGNLSSKKSNKKKKMIIGGAISTFLVASMISCAINLGLSDNSGGQNYYIENLYDGNSYSSDVTDEEIDSIVSYLEDELGCEIVEANEDEYCLLNAIVQNPNLSTEEKRQFYKCINLILDNPYVNKEAVYHAFSYVNVEEYYSDNGSIQGDYCYENNLIRIYDPAGGNTLSHESIHSIYSNENTRLLPKYFKEGMTELLNNEYFDDQPFCELDNYYYEIIAVKLLCDLTSPDAVLKAYTTGDMSGISEELARNAGTELYKAEDAMIKLNVTFERIYSGTFDLSNENMISDFNVVLNYFDMCARNMEFDTKTQEAYDYNSQLLRYLATEDLNQSYLDYVDRNGFVTKAYFSSSLKGESTGINSAKYKVYK